MAIVLVWYLAYSHRLPTTAKCFRKAWVTIRKWSTNSKNHALIENQKWFAHSKTATENYARKKGEFRCQTSPTYNILLRRKYNRKHDIDRYNFKTKTFPCSLLFISLDKANVETNMANCLEEGVLRFIVALWGRAVCLTCEETNTAENKKRGTIAEVKS